MNTEASGDDKNRIIEEAKWRSASEAHWQFIRGWTEPFRKRRQLGRSHPIHDFLFVYYQYSPARLERWHPGVGIALAVNGPTESEKDFGFDSGHYCFQENRIQLRRDALDQKQIGRLRWVKDLLQATSNRPGNFSCLGMHEWAMVYRGQEIRHRKTANLRLSQSEIDQLVETRPITCTHFDAFRFFAEPAVPLNRFHPTMESRGEMEQPACIHANMDLYKWCFKSMPWVGSDLLRDCFVLAMEAREIDMRASPYDLSDYGDVPPIKIETAAGRSEYEKLQRKIAQQAIPLRARLIQQIDRVLHWADG